MHLLLDAAVRNAPGRRLTAVNARLTRPIYVGDTITLAGGAPAEGTVPAWVADKDGMLAAQMDLTFA